jgi:hypothetical protein
MAVSLNKHVQSLLLTLLDNADANLIIDDRPVTVSAELPDVGFSKTFPRVVVGKPLTESREFYNASEFRTELSIPLLVLDQYNGTPDGYLAGLENVQLIGDKLVNILDQADNLGLVSLWAMTQYAQYSFGQIDDFSNDVLVYPITLQVPVICARNISFNS